MSITKNILLRIPLFGKPLINLIWSLKKRFIQVNSSGKYWEQLYQSGGNSGEGSYNQLAHFKALIINQFLIEHKIKNAIEFGCGDGNQLSLINYPSYIGVDVSETIIDKCKSKFKNDSTKSFYCLKSSEFIEIKPTLRSELTLSLDVIYHLLEDDTYQQYMIDLFNASEKYVIIYSSNFDSIPDHHERDHNFTNWVETNRPDYRLKNIIKNKFPYDKKNAENTSKADFYFFEKA